jgi:tetratricopeptide (TPR) repeat protein
MVRDHPVIGVGPGNYAYWSPRYLGEALWAPGGGVLLRGAQHMHNEVHTLHAHSEPIEVAAEMGTIGLALCLWILARVVRCRGPEWSGLAALLAFSLFNSPFHSPPHALTGLLLAGGLLARWQEEEKGATVHTRAWLTYLVPTTSIALAAFAIWLTITPSYQLRRAEDLHLASQGAPQESVFEAYERALRHPAARALTSEKLGIALFEADLFTEARDQFTKALRGLDTGGVYLALGALDMQLHDRDSARKWLEECVLRWPSNEAAWVLLMRSSEPANHETVLTRARRWLPEKAVQRLKAEEAATCGAHGPEQRWR